MFVVGALAADPFLRPSGNHCADNAFEAYASASTLCDAAISPIRAWNVNSKSGRNGYCALEWALVYDRPDMFQEAIDKGGDPFKCHTSGIPFFFAMREATDRRGADRVKVYLSTLKDKGVVSKKSAAQFVRRGIYDPSIDLIRYGLEAGHLINEPMDVKYENGRFKDIYHAKTPLYVASSIYLMYPTERYSEVVSYLVSQGAVPDPELKSLVNEGRSRFKPEAVATLEVILSAK